MVADNYNYVLVIIKHGFDRTEMNHVVFFNSRRGAR